MPRSLVVTLFSLAAMTGCGGNPEGGGSVPHNVITSSSSAVWVDSFGQVYTRADSGVIVGSDGRTFVLTSNGVYAGSDGSTIVRADNGVWVGSNGTTYTEINRDDGSSPGGPSTPRPDSPEDLCPFPERDVYVAGNGAHYFKWGSADGFVGTDGSTYRLVSDGRCVDTNGDGWAESAGASLKPVGNVWGVADNRRPQCNETEVSQCLKFKGGQACFTKWCR